jgi:hypothetical protein
MKVFNLFLKMIKIVNFIKSCLKGKLRNKNLKRLQVSIICGYSSKAIKVGINLNVKKKKEIKKKILKNFIPKTILSEPFSLLRICKNSALRACMNDTNFFNFHKNILSIYNKVTIEKFLHVDSIFFDENYIFVGKIMSLFKNLIYNSKKVEYSNIEDFCQCRSYLKI